MSKNNLNYKLADILVAPHITEKTTSSTGDNAVAFLVKPNATKPEIRMAVEKYFNVKVESVNTLIKKGKSRRFRGVAGRTSDSKRAIVRLAKGQQIDFGSGL